MTLSKKIRDNIPTSPFFKRKIWKN